ncbi:MAG: leucyl aminopeptidase [Candidatus Gastranaerophilales bacterium]|nr:leucyl aminopeptidase [Candidatus Gastranaerophilales bacterium]
MEIKLISDVKGQECDVLVVNMFENEKTSEELVNKYAIEEDKFEGKFGSTYLLPTYGNQPARKILAIGFGKKEEFNPNKLREATAKAVKKAMQMEAKTVAFNFTGIDFDYSEQFTYGALIADYSFDKYKTKKDKKIETVFVNATKELVEKNEKICKAMKLSRDLANEPAQYATPSKLAEIAETFGLETKIYEKEDCEKMGMGAYLAVARGSSQPPKFIHMKYTCQNPKKRIAIIGKGICFDSGGLDIKPASSMLTMKDDMSGAACVLGIMSVIKEFNPNVEVHGIIAACENMPGCSAYKPGDILTAKNGKTIEVDNTDAEGRLTLADALCYADELGVDEIIDLATLTGACMVALGTVAAGIVGNNDELVKNIIKVGGEQGERYWELPMFEEYKTTLKSDVADMQNTGSRWGGASTAGLFLKEFVKDAKWAHIDIAGVAHLDKPQNEFIKGSTGAGVRAMLSYILEQ